jgi:hypothetical protein
VLAAGLPVGIVSRSERRMKALIKAEAEPGLRLEDVPVPVPGRDDVLIRVLRTGVCGTDLHIYQPLYGPKGSVIFDHPHNAESGRLAVRSYVRMTAPRSPGSGLRFQRPRTGAVLFGIW